MTVGGDSSLMVNRSLDGASIANIRQNGSLQDTYPSIGENRACEGHRLNNSAVFSQVGDVTFVSKSRSNRLSDVPGIKNPSHTNVTNRVLPCDPISYPRLSTMGNPRPLLQCSGSWTDYGRSRPIWKRKNRQSAGTGTAAVSFGNGEVFDLNERAKFRKCLESYELCATTDADRQFLYVRCAQCPTKGERRQSSGASRLCDAISNHEINLKHT